MVDLTSLSARTREICFYKSLNVTQGTVSSYKNSLRDSILLELLKKDYNISNIFEIVELETLWSIYCKIKDHPKNLSQHRRYTAAIMKYIRYLNDGKKYGRRIDFGKPRGSRKVVVANTSK